MGVNFRVSPIQDQEGQAIVEYIVLLGVVSIVVISAFQWLNSVGFAERIAAPLNEKYALIYKYGDPRLKGPEEGEADHPGLPRRNRYFINPASQ